MVPPGLCIDVHSVFVSDVWIFDRFKNCFVTYNNFYFVSRWFQCVFDSARQRITASVLCVNSHIASNVCVVVESPIVPEFWYTILVDDSSLSINESLYTGSYSCMISDQLPLIVLVGWYNNFCWVGNFFQLFIVWFMKGLIWCCTKWLYCFEIFFLYYFISDLSCSEE